MDNRKKTCCFTGHRYIPAEDLKFISNRLEYEIIKLIEKGVIFFGAGGALGFDTIAALAVLKLKVKYPLIKLVLVLPCKTQTRGWDEKDIVIYENIKDRCSKVVYTSKDYTKGCMFKRNRHLVDFSGYCICYLTKNSGGTVYTVKYAKDNGLKILNIADGKLNKLQSTTS